MHKKLFVAGALSLVGAAALLSQGGSHAIDAKSADLKVVHYAAAVDGHGEEEETVLRNLANALNEMFKAIGGPQW